MRRKFISASRLTAVLGVGALVLGLASPATAAAGPKAPAAPAAAAATPAAPVGAGIGGFNAALLYNGQPQDFYWDTATNSLRHAWWNGAAWNFETLDGPDSDYPPSRGVTHDRGGDLQLRGRVRRPVARVVPGHHLRLTPPRLVRSGDGLALREPRRPRRHRRPGPHPRLRRAVHLRGALPGSPPRLVLRRDGLHPPARLVDRLRVELRDPRRARRGGRQRPHPGPRRPVHRGHPLPQPAPRVVLGRHLRLPAPRLVDRVGVELRDPRRHRSRWEAPQRTAHQPLGRHQPVGHPVPGAAPRVVLGRHRRHTAPRLV